MTAPTIESFLPSTRSLVPSTYPTRARQHRHHRPKATTPYLELGQPCTRSRPRRVLSCQNLRGGKVYQCRQNLRAVGTRTSPALSTSEVTDGLNDGALERVVLTSGLVGFASVRHGYKEVVCVQEREFGMRGGLVKKRPCSNRAALYAFC